MHRHFDGALQQIWEFHILFFCLLAPSQDITTEGKNNLLKTIRDRKEGLLIYTASGTNHDAVNNYSLAACDMVNLPICSVSKEKDCHSKQGHI